MACFMFQNSHPKPRNSCFLFALFMTNFLLSLIFKATAYSLNFSFANFGSNHPEIFTEKDASVADGEIQLTLNQRGKEQRAKFGRATYVQPLHLWDKASGNLTNFTTHFSFVIDSVGSDVYGDGLTFFLAPNGSQIPRDVIDGCGLGLVNNHLNSLNTSINHFVAVEFDTYQNEWDPPRGHAGININSMKSVANVTWNSNVKQGNTTDVWITYDSRQKILSVKFTYINDNNSIMHGNLSSVVDLAIFLPEFVTFGFSGSTGNSYEANTVCSWEFNSSSEIVESSGPEVVVTPPKPVANPTFRKANKSKVALATGLSIGAFALAAGVSFVSIGLRRKMGKGTKADDPTFDVYFGDDFKNGTGPRNFSYDELANATNKFSEGEKLGEGGFGAVYRGFLNDLNSFIAVKRVSRESRQGIKEYMAEVKIISRMRHKNLVKLIGWCHEKELLLAYEFMPNGSLDSHLFKGKSLLTWMMRHKIARDLAFALLYLHEEGDQCVLHRDIKTSNIMLDSTFNAKLGDFGLARLVDHAKGYHTTVVAGTMGYMAPECFTSGKASKESDIYSFGVVALEIACGRRVVEPWIEESQTRLVDWVWELYGMGKILQAADPKLCGDFDEQQMERLMMVGLWCVQTDSMFRPLIRQVINVLLNLETPLPIIPSEMPLPAFLAPPSKLSTSYYMSNCGSATSEKKQTNKSSYAMELIH